MNPITVNDALLREPQLNGSCVTVEGILTFELENISVSHWPKAERKDGYASSIWIEPDGAAFDFDQSVLERWSGKRVVVLGVLEFAKESQVDGWDEGFGHFSMWPAQIRARRIDLLKRWAKDHPEIDNTEQGVAPNA
jgi:hypothetical protein